MTTRPHVSPSQINTFARCPRKWAFSRVAERNETPATKFGTKVHEILESWLLERKLPSANTQEGRCALEGLKHLPMPQSEGLHIEHPLEMEYDDVRYVGRIDFIHVAEAGITVGDHKTTKDLSYAKTEEDLLDDPQRIIYSHFIAQTFGVEDVEAKWVYYQRFPPASAVVSFSESSAAIEERFQELHNKYSLPIVQAHGVDPMELPPNYEACGDFGRCPFIDQCHKDKPRATLSQLLRNHDDISHRK
jgi:RecB family exonuclease